MKKVFFSLVAMLCFVFANAQTAATLDMTNIVGFADWGTSFTTHEATFSDAHATVKFASANKQNSTITDCPVTKGGDIEVVMDNGYLLNSVTFNLKQWNTKAQTATLHYSTNGGSTYTATEITSDSTFVLTSETLPESVNAVKVTFSSTSNQVGLSSVELTYSVDPFVVAVPSFSVTAGSYYVAQSVELTAAEGATIYYSTDGENFTEYTAAIAVAEDATIYAYAQMGEEKSVTVSKSYVIAKTYTSLASLLEVEPSNQPVALVLTNAKITSVYTTSNGNRNGIYVTDGTDTIEIYAYDVPEEWTAGGFVSGTVYGKYQEYKGTKEVCPAGYDGLSYDPAPIFSEGKYYLYNVEAGKFWGAGNSWGTQASLVDHAEYLTLHTVGGKYNIESQVSNGGTAYYFNGSFMDNGSPVSLTIAADSAVAGAYTITNGDAVYGYDGSTTVLSDNAEGNNALWNILTEDDMKAKLAAATEDTPADATWLILDPGFGRNNRNRGAWTRVADHIVFNGNNTNNCVESYHSKFIISQTLSGVPNGVYKLTAQGFYRQDGSDNDNMPVFYINDATGTFPVRIGSENNMQDASVSFSAGKYTIDPIWVQVTDSTITLGAKNEVNTNLWCIWDNFVLTYYGADTDINKSQLASSVDTYKNVLAAAEELATDSASVASIDKATAAALAEAVQTYAEATVLDSPTAESLAAATAALNAVVAKANASINAKAYVDEYYDIIAKNNFVTAEALATYQALADNAQAQWAAGNAEAVVAPYSTQYKSSNFTDDYLLSTWSIGETKANDFDSGLYINTWSVEGNTDGSEFRVPFFEYFTTDANSLGATTLSATLTGLAPGKYAVSAWTRVRLKNNVTDAPTGIKFVVNDGDTVDVTTGAQVGTSQMYLDTFTAEGTVGADSTLTIKYIVEDGNNISWLSFKNVTVVYADVPDVHTTVIDVTHNRIVNQGYTAEEVTYDEDAVKAALGIEDLSAATLAIVDVTTGVYHEYPTDYSSDGWLNSNGDATAWGNGSYVCLKVPANGSMALCTMPENEPAEGSAFNAKWAFYTATDTAILNVTINFVSVPAVDAEVVATIEINHEEAEKTAYSATYETVDVNAVCAALGITSIDEAEYRVAFPDGEDGYTYEGVTTDGWRNAETGAQLGWGNAGGICVKVWADNGQTAGNVTYIGCYDDTHEAGEAYTFYYAFIANNKSVIYKVNINFVGTATAIDGIANGEAAPKGIYNINGQKLSGLQKGLNIVDGKKVYVK